MSSWRPGSQGGHQMAKPQRWTDSWVASLPHPGPGEPEKVYADPVLNKHRLVVKRTKKVFEIQAKRPTQYGPAKTYVVQVGDGLDYSIEKARTQAAAVLARIRNGE